MRRGRRQGNREGKRIADIPPRAHARSGRWLLPLLCLLLGALAALAPWGWRQWRESRRAPAVEATPLRLTGDAQRDREAILERAAAILLQPRQGQTGQESLPLSQAALLGEIGIELLPLDPVGGKQAVEQAIAAATSRPERLTPAEVNAPERTRLGLVIRLARSLKDEPALREAALQRAYEWAHESDHPAGQITALSLFAREAAAMDPTRARAAARQARGLAWQLSDRAPADMLGLVAATVERVEGAEAARPLVKRALQMIPEGGARPLVQARLAAWLAEVAPAQADRLARQAIDGIRIEPQRRAVAALLASSHPDLAMAMVERIGAAVERVGALVEVGAALEARAPERAAALYRRALRQAMALPEGAGRREAVMGAAAGLAGFDLEAARAAVTAGGIEPTPGELRQLARRALEHQPAAALRLLETAGSSGAAAGERSEDGLAILLARVRTAPDLQRALDMAQQGGSGEVRAAALLAVARRFRGEAN